ncbi:hypothetical protein FRC11_002942, partial [Ceratobasidium sp. 423]
QHFQREERLLKDSKGQKLRIAPTLHFRDMPDLFKSPGKVSVDLRGIGAGLATLCMDAGYAEIHDEPAASDVNADDGDAEVQELLLEEWEREAGFDAVIEWTERGSRDVFKVDGINLADPLLIDLLSDKPVPGVVVRGSTSAKKRSAPTDAGSLVTEGSKKRLAPELFQF